MSATRTEKARSAYRAWETDDRDLMESLLADDLVFSSPPDPSLDREGYFERCWPNAGSVEEFQFVRCEEISRDEVLVTYEAIREDGSSFRNTEILGFTGEKIGRIEVYFGWDL